MLLQAADKRKQCSLILATWLPSRDNCRQPEMKAQSCHRHTVLMLGGCMIPTIMAYWCKHSLNTLISYTTTTLQLHPYSSQQHNVALDFSSNSAQPQCHLIIIIIIIMSLI